MTDTVDTGLSPEELDMWQELGGDAEAEEADTPTDESQADSNEPVAESAAPDETDKAEAPPPAPPPPQQQEQVDLIAVYNEAQARLDAIAQKFDDGEITLSEYQKEARPLNKTIARLEAITVYKETESEQRRIAAEEIERAKDQVKWETSVQTFLDSHPEYRVEPGNRASEIKNRILSEEVQRVSQDKAYAGKPYSAILNAAHENVGQVFGAPPAAKKDDKPAKPAPSKKAAPPPTLNDIPPDAPNAAVTSEVDKISKMNASELVAYLATKSNAEQERLIRAIQ